MNDTVNQIETWPQQLHHVTCVTLLGLQEQSRNRLCSLARLTKDTD